MNEGTKEPKGRGPTRAAVRCADLGERVEKLDLVSRVEFVKRMSGSEAASAVRAEAKQLETEMRQFVKDRTIRVKGLRAVADLLAVAETLPPVQQRLLLGALASDPSATASRTPCEQPSP